MRSVTVVLPASMCAMIPILRTVSSVPLVATGIALSCRLPAVSFLVANVGRPPALPAGCTLPSKTASLSQASGGLGASRRLAPTRTLPPIVGERPVRLGHLVGVLTALDGRALAMGGVEELAGELLGHRLALSSLGRADQPAQRQR